MYQRNTPMKYLILFTLLLLTACGTQKECKYKQHRTIKFKGFL